MQIKNPSIALFVEDIAVSKQFYHDILSLEIEFDFGKNIIFKGGIAIWEINPKHIIPMHLGEKCYYPSNRFELYFETENLQDVHATLRDAKVAFLHEVHEESWGQLTIRFFDPDNHLIEIGESMPTFVNRMLLDSGMTKEKVSNKTGISLQDIENIVRK